MKITQETDYALRILMYLAIAGKGVKIDAKTISEAEGVTLRFTLKILRKLAQTGMVISFRGVNGGYALDVEPKDLNMKNVIEAIEGPIYINKCLYDEELCNLNRSSTCKLHYIFSEIQEKVLKEFEDTSIQDILDGKSKKDCLNGKNEKD